jgi:hypothetical protein
MKIGIIGPNKLYKGDIEKRKILLEKVSEIIAESQNEIVLTPDKKGLLEFFGRKYLEHGGKKINIIAPMDESDCGNYLCTEIGEVVSCGKWQDQAYMFNKESNVFICIGYSWGAMREIGFSQHFFTKKTYILKEFVSGKLPEELNNLVEYIGIDELKKKIETFK